MKLGFLYAGQGSQHPGMGADLYETCPAFRSVLDRAAEQVDFDLKEVSFTDAKGVLNQTRYTQPCMVAFAAGMTALLAERGIVPAAAAGLSLGEYSALHAAGVFDADTAVKLVAFRGKAMEEAAAGRPSAMVAVLGLDRAALQEACDEASAHGCVVIANYNCPGQLVLGGEKAAVEAAAALAKEKGARRCLPLKVSGPFHSPFMKPAGEKLERELEQVRLSELQIPYVSNVSAQPITKTEQIRSLLSQGVYSPVKWEQSMRTMLAEGVEYFVEIGPGHTLSTLLKKINAEAKICTVSTMEDLVRMQDFLNETV